MIADTIRELRMIQKRIDRRDNENEVDRAKRDGLIDQLIEGGMGPKEALAIVGLGRNAYYQRKRRQS